MKRCLLIFIFFIFAIQSEELNWQTQQEECAVYLRIAPSSIEIQSTLLIKAEISYPSSYTVSLEAFKQSFHMLDASWSLVKQTQTISVSGDQEILHLEAELAPLREGRLFLSLFDIHFANASEASVVIWTPLFIIQVNPAADLSPGVASVLPLEPQYPIGLSLANRELLYGSSALGQETRRIQHRLAMQSFPWLFVLFVLLSSIGWLLWRSIRPFRVPHVTIPLPPPSEEALNVLERLQKQNLPQQEKYNEYFTDLTNLLRRYLERTFQLPASFKTTDELLAYLDSESNIPSNAKEFLRSFFLQADQIKFAKRIPNKQECEEAYMQVKRFI